MKKQIVCILVMVQSMILGLYAQPGSLDSLFGINGIVDTPFPLTTFSGATGVAIQSDGKIIAAGTSGNRFALVRYESTGSIDMGFGTNGRVITDLGNGNDEVFAMKLQNDGKILVTGSTILDSTFILAVVRYNTDGALDNSFGNGGIVLTDVGMYDEIGKSITIQPDNKIVVAGSARVTFPSINTKVAVIRYFPNGALDYTFSGDGKDTISIGVSSAAYSVAIQTDGKIVLAGAAWTGPNAEFMLIRYNSDGTFDSSFGENGKLTTDIEPNSNDYAYSLAIQADGKLVAAGYTDDGDNADFALARYLPDGTLDNSFDTDGKISTDVYFEDYISAVAIQSDGKILALGSSDNYIFNRDISMVRYNMDGSLDNSFSGDGKLNTDYTHWDDGRAMAIQSDQKIVVAGMTVGGGGSFILARYLSGLEVGTLDFSLSDNAAFLYPNPITRQATLSYSLKQEETLSIQLSDMQGRLIATYLDHQKQEAGDHSQTILFPPDLPDGAYLLVISNGKGKVSVKMVK